MKNTSSVLKYRIDRWLFHRCWSVNIRTSSESETLRALFSQHLIVFFGTLPSVLVPSLDLCVCQVESRSQIHTILHAEVFLSLKAPLQLVELVVGEGCPCFARFFCAHRRTVSAAGDLTVPLFLSPYTNRARWGIYVLAMENQAIIPNNEAILFFK